MEVAGDALLSAAKARPACGREATHTRQSAVRERVWNELSKAWAVDSLCAYDANMIRRDDDSRDTLQRICSEHSAVHFRGADWSPERLPVKTGAAAFEAFSGTRRR